LDFESALNAIDEADVSSCQLGASAPSYPDFPIDEYQARYARLVSLMDHVGAEAMVLTQEEPIRYLSGYNSVIWAVGRWLPGAMIATRDPKDAVLLPSAFDVGAATGTSWVPNIDGHTGPDDLVERVGGHLETLGVSGRSLAVERGVGSIVMLPFPSASKLMDLASPDSLDAAEVMSALRMRKSPREIERVRRIVGATVAGYAAGVEAAQIGMTEKEIVSIVASGIYANGGTAGTRPLFLNAVAGPDRYPLVDTPASDRTIRSGDVLFLDGGAGGDGYMSDIIRLVAFGDVPDEVHRYAAVAARATEAMVATAVPGVRASEVYRAGQAVFENAGLGEFGGGLSGHGIGLEIWERPMVREHEDPNEDIRLRPGMTLCLEPILVPPTDDGGLAGIFVFEQQIAVTESGNEVLSGDLDATLRHVP
jgi:Xaa-Pro aminopeptidase